MITTLCIIWKNLITVFTIVYKDYSKLPLAISSPYPTDCDIFLHSTKNVVFILTGVKWWIWLYFGWEFTLLMI